MTDVPNPVTEPGTTVNIDPKKGGRITVRMSRTAQTLTCDRVRFNTDSAVLQPSGLRVIAAAFQHAKANPGLKLLIASHTDRQGGEEDNQALSEARAKNVLHIFAGERKEWIESCKRENKSLQKDVRGLLTWAAEVWNIEGCKPKAVTNDPRDAALDALVSAFKKGFAKRFSTNYVETNEAPDIDFTFWGKVYNLYVWTLVDQLRVDKPADLAAFLKNVTWVDEANRSIGCGERFPAKPTADGQAAAENRRTEFLFFPANQEPMQTGFEGNPDPAEYLKGVYAPKRYKFEPIPCPPPLFYGEPIPEGNVVFVIDISGSMRPTSSTGDRIGSAKRNLNLAIADLADDARFGVVAYDTTVRFLWGTDAPKVEVASEAKRSEARTWVNALAPNGVTNTNQALEAAFKATNLDESKPKTVKLLSDGSPTPRAWIKDPKASSGLSAEQAKKADVDERAKILADVATWSGGKWRVDTVGLFTKVGETGPLVDFMKDLATKNGGTFSHVAVPARPASTTPAAK